jgi:UDP-N-acetylmuramyl pentapeptide phosphotransferase/UDP-N-acetylglucosamine-1-phosphate transferase
MSDSLRLLLATLTGFVVTFYLIPALISYFTKREVHDHSDHRKIHDGVKPSMGGIAFVIGWLVSIIGFEDWTSPDSFFSGAVFVAFSLILLVGFMDDLNALRPYWKLSVQIPAALILIYFGDIRIESFYGFLGIEVLPIWFSYLITVFYFVVLTNAFNLIDGLDGLNATITSIVLAFFGIYFYLVDYYQLSVACLALLGALFAFLRYNWEPSHLFMGDTGALFIGFFVSIISVRFLQINGSLPEVHPYHFENVITILTAVLCIPLFDTLRVFIIRMMAGHSPFRPDQNHVHHLLYNSGFGHAGTVCVLGFANLVMIGLASFGAEVSDNITLPLLIAFSLSIMQMLYLRFKYVKKRAKVQLKGI